MELDDLAAFVAVVEHNGFRRAAEALYVSQPSLPRRIARLEQELGVILLERSSRGILITSRGESLLSSARRLLATVAETRATVSGHWTDSIVIACTTTAAERYLSTFIAAWAVKNPGIRIKMIEDGPNHNHRRLADHGCDAALVAPPLGRDFESLPIGIPQVFALIPSSHRLAASEAPLGIEELEGEPLFVPGEHYMSSQLLRSSCRILGIAPDIVFECSAGPTLAALVRAELGIAILSDAVSHSIDGLVRRSLQERGCDLSFEMHIAWARGRLLNPLVAEFARALSQFSLARQAS